jgi:hypothetical protein
MEASIKGRKTCSSNLDLVPTRSQLFPQPKKTHFNRSCSQRKHQLYNLSPAPRREGLDYIYLLSARSSSSPRSYHYVSLAQNEQLVWYMFVLSKTQCKHFMSAPASSSLPVTSSYDIVFLVRKSNLGYWDVFVCSKTRIDAVDVCPLQNKKMVATWLRLPVLICIATDLVQNLLEIWHMDTFQNHDVYYTCLRLRLRLFLHQDYDIACLLYENRHRDLVMAFSGSKRAWMQLMFVLATKAQRRFHVFASLFSYDVPCTKTSPARLHACPLQNGHEYHA